MHNCFLSLGSNIGDRESQLRQALRFLAEEGRIESCSSYYETEPVGEIEQEDFLNIVVLFQTSLDPEQLLKLNNEIEQKLNRIKIEKWGPRTIDIDIISFDDLELETENLIVPHPQFHRRKFVLIPLNEIASTHMIFGKTIAEYLEACDDNSIVKKLGELQF